ncbi:MAG: hypothetical protein K6C09_08430 [Oscillospiraceae bacterium]|nr:hypothetical protein [Oscillospiraceae bacterium]
MMDIEEMKVEYRLAKDQKEQIRLIADQCLMKPREIADMLRNAGEDVDTRWFPKPHPKRKAGTEKLPAEPKPMPKDMQHYIDIALAVAEAHQEAADLRRENEQLRATLDRMAEILFPMLPKPGEEE